MDTIKEKRIETTERTKKGRLEKSPNPFDMSPKGLSLDFCSES